MSDRVEQLTVHWRKNPVDARTINTRLQIERLFETVNLTPHGMLDSEILIIKRMSGIILLDDLRRLNLNWEYQVRSRVDALYRAAPNPARQPIPYNADAIVFDDAIQMLITLTDDTHANTIQTKWYWRSVLPNISLNGRKGGVLQAAWSKYAQWVPTLVANLAPNILINSIKLLQTVDSNLLLDAISIHFNVDLRVPTKQILDLDREHTPSHQSIANWQSLLVKFLGEKVSASLSTTVINLLQELSTEQVDLLSTCLLLHYEPQRIFRPNFQYERAEVWVASQKIVSQSKTKTVFSREPANLQSREPIADAMTIDPSKTAEFQLGKQVDITGELSWLCGIFYLINLLKALSLPESNPIGLSGWAIMEGWARLFLSSSMSNAYQDDVVWTLLRQLDGREANTLIDCDNRSDFALIPTWLNNRRDYQWGVMAPAGRLIIFDLDTNFIVLDEATENDLLDETIETRLATYRDIGLNIKWEYATFDTASNDNKPIVWATKAVASWFNHMLPFVRVALSRYLGTETTIDEMLTVSGWLTLTRTHLDIHIPLSQVNLDVRRSGLDANPNWMPTLQRIIQFHFVDVDNKPQ